jgi:hypothetical protein
MEVVDRIGTNHVQPGSTRKAESLGPSLMIPLALYCTPSSDLLLPVYRQEAVDFIGCIDSCLPRTCNPLAFHGYCEQLTLLGSATPAEIRLLVRTCNTGYGKLWNQCYGDTSELLMFAMASMGLCRGVSLSFQVLGYLR